MILLGKKLAERQHELFFFSGGVAYKMLKNAFSFENVYRCTPVVWYETARGAMVSASILNILFPLPHYNYEHDKFELKSSNAAETIHRYYDLRWHLPRIKPDLIVADGDMHALRLASRWKIPTVYITNIIRPSYRFSPLLIPGERFTERYVKKCTRIIIPDNPHYTICEHNLGNLDAMKLREKVEFVGSFFDLSSEKGSKQHLFVSISGPFGTRVKLAKTIIPVLSKLEGKSVVSLGKPGRKFVRTLSNCELHTWLTNEERYRFMRNASVIVFSGGHGTCFEVIKHRKPSVCIPTQPEQMGNAKKMQELNCSITVEDKEQLVSAIMKITEQHKNYEESVKRLQEYSGKFKGLNNAVATIENTI